MRTPSLRDDGRYGALAAVVVVALLGQGAVTDLPGPVARPAAQLRVDQAGYARGEGKYAILMTSRPAAGVRYVIRHAGQVVASGKVLGPDRGGWNATYRHTYVIDFTGPHRIGSYRISVDSTPRVAATIRIAS